MTSTAIRPEWTPMNIGLMILGFIVFWPLGLAMLAYILWGDRFHELADRARSKAKHHRCRGRGFSARTSTGNLAFDEYRQAELDRLAEERRKLEEERFEFETFVEELRRVKDKEDFDRFMNARAAREEAEDIEVDDAPKPQTRRTRAKKTG